MLIGVNKIWCDIVASEFPKLSEEQLIDLRITATIDYGTGRDTQLAKMFEQYLIWKALKKHDSI
jgi:hypothetical protein